MKIIYGDYKFVSNFLEKDNVKKKLNLSIGFFDGFHFMHEKIIKSLKDDGYLSAIITFDNNYKTDLEINSLGEKIYYFKEFCVDLLIILKFDLVLKQLTYDKFNYFLEKLNVNKLYVGSNFRYGFNNEGNIDELSKKFNVVSFALNDNVNSTYLRNLLNDNKFDEYLIYTSSYIIKG